MNIVYFIYIYIYINKFLAKFLVGESLSQRVHSWSTQLNCFLEGLFQFIFSSAVSGSTSDGMELLYYMVVLFLIFE